MNAATSLQPLAGLLQYARSYFIAGLFQLQRNKCCSKIKQNIYSIAAFILFFAHRTSAEWNVVFTSGE